MPKTTETHESKPIVAFADPNSLTGDLKVAVDAYVERMGFLPNALKLYMHRPELLSCLIRLNNTVMRDETSHLDQELKRRIAAVCSALNQSAYCVAHNANTLRTAGDSDGEGWDYSDSDIEALLDPNYLPDDPVERACFDYARAATRDASNVPQQIVERLAEVLTPPQVVELACVVGFWKMYNGIHESLYVPLEDELLGDAEVGDDELFAEDASGARLVAQAEVEIYTSRSCPFCRKAKRVLSAKGATYRETVIDGDADALAEMMSRAKGRKTVPQIFADGVHIGGMDDLAALARTGALHDTLRVVAE